VIVQPGRQVDRTTEIEQGFCQGFKLIQRQGLDPGVGGFAEGAAAAVEQAKGYLNSLSAAATGFAFLPALLNPLLGHTGVAQVFGGNGCDLHDYFLSMEREWVGEAAPEG